MQINKTVSTIILFIIILILVFLFVLPKYHESKDLQSELFKKQLEYNNKSVYYAEISKVVANIDSKKDDVEKINTALPSDFSFAPLMYFLQKEATDSGLAIQSIRFSKISERTPQKAIRDNNFSISMSGSYQGLRTFLSSLDKSVFLFEVKSISFQSVQNPDLPEHQSPIYNFVLEVVTHTY